MHRAWQIQTILPKVERTEPLDLSQSYPYQHRTFTSRYAFTANSMSPGDIGPLTRLHLMQLCTHRQAQMSYEG